MYLHMKINAINEKWICAILTMNTIASDNEIWMILRWDAIWIFWENKIRNTINYLITIIICSNN